MPKALLSVVIMADRFEGLTARHWALPTSPLRTKAQSQPRGKRARYVRAAKTQCLCKLVVLPTNTEPDHGSCHCGAVTLAVKVDKPLEERDITVDEERICECNCSVCIRVRLSLTEPQTDRMLTCAADTYTQGAYIWIYPHIEDSVIEGREHLEYRSFNTNVVRKSFCRHCGVHVCNEPNPITGEQTANTATPA